MKGDGDMKPRLTEERSIALAGMDFFGNPYLEAGGWSEANAIGQLWSRFSKFFEANKDRVRFLVSGSGYEVWIDLEGEEDTKNECIFVGVEVEQLEDLPLELVGKMLPPTRYAVFTLKGDAIKSDWPNAMHSRWLPDAGLEKSHSYIIEHYDEERFKGMDDPESELDIYVPIE